MSGIDSATKFKLMLANTIGMSVLMETLKDASYALNYTSGARLDKVIDAHDSLAFIQGTGLDLMLYYYKLDYNAENIRMSFFTKQNRRDLIE